MNLVSIAMFTGGLLVFVTLGLSALLHGLSAAPLANSYGRLASRMGECEENQPVTELPLREGRTNPEGNYSPVIPAGIAGIQLPWMVAMVGSSICHPWHWIPASPWRE